MPILHGVHYSVPLLLDYIKESNLFKIGHDKSLKPLYIIDRSAKIEF